MLTFRLCRFYHRSRFLLSSKLEVKNERATELSETADMTVGQILNFLETKLNKYSPQPVADTNTTAALRHLAWKVRPADSVNKRRPKFVRIITANSVDIPTASELCGLQSFKLLLQNINQRAEQLSCDELTDVVSAVARKDFTVELRVPDLKMGKQQVPLLRGVFKRLLVLLQEIPFRTLLRALVALSREGLGFERDQAFAALTQELIERTSSESLGHIHWTLLARSLQDMADYLRLQDKSKLLPSIATLTQHLRRLLENGSAANPANMLLTIQALALLDPDESYDWKPLKSLVVLRASQVPYPGTLMHLASMDRLDLLRENLSYGIIHQILQRAVEVADRWQTSEILQVLGTLVELGFRHEHLLAKMATRLISQVKNSR